MRFLAGWKGATLLTLVGVGAGAFATYSYISKHDPVTFFNGSCSRQFPLTSKYLDCDNYDDSSARLHTLETSLSQLADAYKAEGKATRLSIWVRDLTTLQWASVADTERYAPASLMKLPLMIAYYKVAEIEPSILNTKIIYTKSEELNADSQDFAPAEQLVEGKEYSVSDLIEHMIVDSDNNAAALLLTHMDNSIFEGTLIDLGIKIPGNMQNYDFITVKSYSSIFRMLYNASYLDREFSQKALNLLSQANFKGIADPLPKDATVAHKFGEREVDNPDGTVQTRELHDCGIIYKDSHPYSLCVMSEGKDFNDLLSILKSISLLTFTNL